MEVTACHDAVVLPYAAYLRVYEPLSAFPAKQARHWLAYATAARPPRAGSLAAEQAGSVRRLIATPPLAAPECESGDAYVRWSDGGVSICPWQTRLRSWLALARLRATSPALAKAAFPGGYADRAARDFAHWRGQDARSRKIYIQVSTWTVPFAWFIPFVTDERWLVLGTAGDRGDGGRATVSDTRTLVYATPMAVARGRVARAQEVIRRVERSAPRRALDECPPAVAAGLTEAGSWLKEFHPDATVELDYGGLVHLFDDGALCADQSVAEAAAAIGALAAGEAEFAAAMYRRFVRRWQALEALRRAC